MDDRYAGLEIDSAGNIINRPVTEGGGWARTNGGIEQLPNN